MLHRRHGPQLPLLLAALPFLLCAELAVGGAGSLSSSNSGQHGRKLKSLIDPNLDPSTVGGGTDGTDAVGGYGVPNPCLSVYEIILQRNLTMLKGVLVAGLGNKASEIFSPYSNLTLFAPSDTAFAAYGITPQTIARVPSGLLSALASRHMMTPRLNSTDVMAMSRRPDAVNATGHHKTWAGTQMKLGLLNGVLSVVHGWRNRTANVSLADISACRSAVHMLDAVV